MSTVPLGPVRESDFRADTNVEGLSLTVTLTGTADQTVKPAVEVLLADVHATAVSIGLQRVSVDVRRLVFMNSACLKCFVTWITKIQSGHPENQYKVVFLSSISMHWQKRSLFALSRLASELVSVDTGS